MVSINHQWESAHAESDGHVISDVTCPQKVKVVTLLPLRPHISLTMQGGHMVPMDH